MEKVLDSVAVIFKSSAVRILDFFYHLRFCKRSDLFNFSWCDLCGWKSHLNARRNKIRTNDRRECVINITR